MPERSPSPPGSRAAAEVRLLLVLATAAAACQGDAGRGGETTLRDERSKMGTRFEIQVVARDRAKGRAAIEAAYAEIDRVEALLSEWRETSEISELNRRAGSGPVGVGPELFEVLERSQRIAELTGGAFDVTFAACAALWQGGVPADSALADCRRHVGYRRLRLDVARSTIEIPDPAMRVGIAGVGKGYGVDRAARVLAEHGIDRYIVDGGGDIRVSGTNVGRPWRVGIADPRRRGELYAALELDRGAVVTSGDYERYFEQDGVRYHHILDPATGQPARASVGVTVVAPDATDADALATGLFVLGPGRAIELVETLPDTEVLLFGPDLAVHRSSGFPQLATPGRSGAE